MVLSQILVFYGWEHQNNVLLFAIQILFLSRLYDVDLRDVRKVLYSCVDSGEVKTLGGTKNRTYQLYEYRESFMAKKNK